MNNEHLKPELRDKIDKALSNQRRRERVEGGRGRKKRRIPRPPGAPYWLPDGPFWKVE